MLRKTLVLISAFLVMTILALEAMAGFGGGAIVRIDHGPGELVAGETVDVMYTVLWMGETPVAGPSSIQLRPAEGTAGPVGGLTFEGSPTSTPGQYIAEVTFPSDGSWLWAVHHSRGATDLGSIDVAPMTVVTALNGDVVALALAAAATAGLALFLSRAKLEIGPGVLDHGTQVGAEGA